MSGAWLHVFRSDELILQGRYLDCTYSYFFYLMQSDLVVGTFPDGTKLIIVHDPVSCENGNLEIALHGSFLQFPIIESCKIPGELIFKYGYILLNSEREAVVLKVTNNGDRPIEVGSHYHFIEVNPTRFEPGDTKSATLVKIGGMQVIRGGNAIADSPANDSNVRTVMESVNARGFGNSKIPKDLHLLTIYHVRLTPICTVQQLETKFVLGDIDLIAEIEKDFSVYGDECVFGGGKVIRDGM
ncbi:hypothetical protein L1887_02889 [Cichorium endivia]|nr:hypothetical protein L1887_02889 [Cichorium endivia]